MRTIKKVSDLHEGDRIFLLVDIVDIRKTMMKGQAKCTVMQVGALDQVLLLKDGGKKPLWVFYNNKPYLPDLKIGKYLGADQEDVWLPRTLVMLNEEEDKMPLHQLMTLSFPY